MKIYHRKNLTNKYNEILLLNFNFIFTTLSLIAQPADAVKLSSEQIALIQNQGATGIQTVFEELEIDIQDFFC